MFGKGSKKRAKLSSESLGETIEHAAPGDVFTITGLAIEYEDSYFVIDKIHKYESSYSEWREVIGSDGEHKLVVNWSDDGGLYVTAAPEARPMALRALGITEDDLARMDSEHSLDNHLDFNGMRYYYKNSGEAFFYEDSSSQGQGFWIWEFASEDEDRVMSIDKWENTPFQGYASDVISPESLSVYKK